MVQVGEHGLAIGEPGILGVLGKPHLVPAHADPPGQEQRPPAVDAFDRGID